MKKILQVNHVTKTYGSQTAVNDLSLTLYEGDIYGFIGKNGAGKTTLIRMIAGLAKPTDGCILLFGSQDLAAQRSNLGTVIESPALYPNMTAYENMMVQCKLMDLSDANEHIKTVLTMTGLQNTGKKKARNFSLGMKQRLAIAIALLSFPKLLILDEPTNGLDPEGIREIRELILKLNQKYHITVLISSHILGELSKFATRYGIIHEGTLLEEFTEKELLERCRSDQTGTEDLEDYFINVIHHASHQKMH
ncbi:MAG TPA: lantibiotic ABC transporter ATP-binding protein [Lachnospiraceae bacterium]|nr:lantibiotic ABC transporter ATP-binding protein [Lachnospiraceae bacterium]